MKPMEAGHVDTALAVAPGEGALARRGSIVLFVPRPDDATSALFEALVDAPDDGAWDSVSRVVMDGSFTCPPFVFVDVCGPITLRVFGDVSLETDLPSVPMLSGASSSTWVEHAVPGSERLAAPASIGCGETPSASGVATDLCDGVVPAGGFALTMRPAECAQDAPPATAAPVAEAAPEPVDRIAKALDVLGPSEPAAEAAPVEEEAVEEPPVADEADDEERTLPPPEPVVEPGTPSVTARLCGDGHPNRPSRLTCSSCDSFLTPGDEGLQLVPRPIVGTLVFDDGIKVDLAKPVVIGRAPQADGSTCEADVETLVFDSDRVSRTHLEVRLSDWDVSVVDRESRNGTVVVPADGAQPVKVDPSAPQLIEPGAVVYFGTRSFTLR